MRINCPFYGRVMYQPRPMFGNPPFLLLDQQGNACAIITNAHAPCMMEHDGRDINWHECPLVKELRMENNS